MGQRWTGTELQRWRRVRGLSVRALARELSVSPSTVSRWERGKRAIPPQLALWLAGLGLRLAERKRGKRRRVRDARIRERDRERKREARRVERERRGEVSPVERESDPGRWW